MEKEEKQSGNDEKTETSSKSGEHEFVLQWGKRRRIGGICRKVSSRFVSDTTTTTNTNSPFRLSRVTEASGNGKSPSPEKEERYYSTRGSSVGDEKEKGRSNVNGNGVGVGVGIDSNGGGDDKRSKAWPKLYISLSSKEKEEDFLAMKGCKLPQRPKKRAKVIQRTLLLVSPGAWLTDMCQERYEVREKKTPKKRPRGLKAMGNVVDTDSE